MVGCGRGDPELLTGRALNVLREAGVVVYDILVSDAVLALSRVRMRNAYMSARSATGTSYRRNKSIFRW